jgi:hypothetical protein
VASLSPDAPSRLQDEHAGWIIGEQKRGPVPQLPPRDLAPVAHHPWRAPFARLSLLRFNTFSGVLHIRARLEQGTGDSPGRSFIQSVGESNG